MKVSAIIGTKDEDCFLAPNVTRLFKCGFESVLIIDDHSTDNTKGVVSRLQDQFGDERVCFSLAEDDLLESLRADSTTALGRFIDRNNPDWIMFIDADEFVLPMQDDIGSVVGNLPSDLVKIARYNVPLLSPVLLPDAAWNLADYRDLPLIVETEDLSPAGKGVSKPWAFHKIVPKVICRSESFYRFNLGAHNAFDRSGNPLKSSLTSDIIIAHFPFSTLERFELKVKNAEEFLQKWAVYYNKTSAWHWRKWIAISKASGLADEFQAQTIPEEELGRLVDQGVIRRAADVLDSP